MAACFPHVASGDIAALATRSPSILATLPSGDSAVQSLLEEALGVKADVDAARADEKQAPSLYRLQAHLFADTAPSERDLDETVSVISAPVPNDNELDERMTA